MWLELPMSSFSLSHIAAFDYIYNQNHIFKVVFVEG